MASDKYLIGRQPIVTRQGQLCAYELLFRSSPGEGATVTDASFATASVIVNTLSSFGAREILGGHQGFINVELDLLMGDALEILPREMVVLELLETLTVSAPLVERCRQLKEAGFTLALDDHEYSPLYEELYSIVDIVKVDLIQTPLARLPEMVSRFRPYPLQLLAEKVESREEFAHCVELGFDYFQGYFFAKPLVMERKRIDEATATLLKLLQLLQDDAPLDEIVAAFQGNPGLTYKLLLLVNSVGTGTREKIKNPRHAIAMLGRQQIKRWVQLAIFAAGDDAGAENPLVDMAAVRAGFMEHLAGSHPRFQGIGEVGDQAFMTGILSLMETIYAIPTAEVVRSLNLSDEVGRALLHREGPLGELLACAEEMERLDFAAAETHLEALGITHSQVLEAQRRSFGWKTPR